MEGNCLYSVLRHHTICFTFLKTPPTTKPEQRVALTLRDTTRGADTSLQRRGDKQRELSVQNLFVVGKLVVTHPASGFLVFSSSSPTEGLFGRACTQGL